MSKKLKWLLLGIFLTPITILLGVISSGGGHGDYLLTRLLFPYTMLFSIFSGYIRMPYIFLAFLQYPIYGYLFGDVRNRKIILILHIIAIITSFIIPTDIF